MIQFSERQWADMRREALEVVPQAFADGRLPALLMGYQQRGISLLEEVSTRVLVVEKSRRIGYTWGLASYAVLRAGRTKSARGMDVMYISYSQEMTREFVDACAMWARAFAIAAAEEQEFLFDDVDADNPGETRQIKAFRIRFASGFEIIALSSAPRSLRGKQGVVIIDEAAFVESLAQLLKAAMAFLMWGGQVVVVSTHNGTDNPFNELVQETLSKKKPYKHLRIDFDDALKDGLFERICLIKGDDWTPEAEAAWRAEIVSFYGEAADEELFCIPTEGGGAWLPTTLIEARMTAKAPVLRFELPADFLYRPQGQQRAMMEIFTDQLREALLRLDQKKRHALGFDFGRVGDLSVAWLNAIEDNLDRSTALVVEMRRFPHTEQVIICRMIIRAIERFMGGAFDATGEGNAVAEALQREFGVYDYKSDQLQSGIIAAIKLTTEWYRTEMPPVKAAFEDGTIAIVKDADHRDDLRVVQVIHGVPQVPAIRTGEKGKKRHADAAVALALAWFATLMNAAEYSYQRVAATAEAAAQESWHGGELGGSGWREPLGRSIRGSTW